MSPTPPRDRLASAHRFRPYLKRRARPSPKLRFRMEALNVDLDIHPFVHRNEVAFDVGTERADPIVGQILKSDAGRDGIVRVDGIGIADRRIVDVGIAVLVSALPLAKP